MSDAINILIVGAGRFARNYVQTLAGLCRARAGLFPSVATLIVSRTRLSAAQTLAAEIRQEHPGCFAAVAGAEIGDKDQLEAVLAQYRPALICITARDRLRGDAVHVDYVPPALACGAVLCEKPFSVARGDGASLAALKALGRHPHARRFGLELPMAVVRPAILADGRLGPLLAGADDIELFWQKQNESRDLVSDLAVHPWSLLPAGQPMVIDEFREGGGRLEAVFRWGPDARPGRMVLAVGGRRRCLRAGGHVLELGFSHGRMQILEHTTSWDDFISGRRSDKLPALRMEVDNPLQQQIVALLRGHPLVDLQQAFASQLFLEQLRGFRKSGQDL